MLQSKRTPSFGLKILEKLYEDNPHYQNVCNNLINAYIHLGFHDKSISMIKSIPPSKRDIQSLKFKVWLAHKKKDYKLENKIWDEILNKMYYPGTHAIVTDLINFKRTKIQTLQNDILLFSVVRNEMLRLPFFLEYYRQLGISKFFFIDNNSDDGSLEFLLSQPDCYVYWTNSSHSQAGAGMAWIQQLIDKYVLDNQWYLVVDADEFLIYPYCEEKGLNILVRYLDDNNYNALASYMLDMFPKNQQSQLNITSGDDLIENSPYFYNHYVFNHQIESPYHQVSGGIFHIHGQNQLLNKISLLKKTNSSIKLLRCSHQTTPTTPAKITSCFLHFKFIGDFYQQSLNETIRKEHWAGGTHYRGYIRLLEKLGNNDFVDLDRVVEYQDSHQLVKLGLIKTSKKWDSYI